MKDFGNNMAAWIIGTGMTLILGIARIGQMFAKHSNKDALQQHDINEMKKSSEKLEERTFNFNKEMGVIRTENQFLKDNLEKTENELKKAESEIEKLKNLMNEFDKRFIKLEK
ncbi:hypothetical protein BKI52_02750 [marine bacterium AO1-C]|nr:hypothetical protein BKI52_02750 [marine bacterium AO1-C]